MEQKITNYLRKLKEYGIKNDIPNVTKEVGQFLNMLIRMRKPRRILEIGCANGYSTIWMAEAAKRVHAKIYAIDHSKPTLDQAKNNLSEIGFSKYVQFYFGGALELMNNFNLDNKFDFVFVDGEKRSYLDFWNALQPYLATHSVIVFDDMMAFPKKTKEFCDTIKNVDGFDQIMLPIDGDDGILLLVKN